VSGNGNGKITSSSALIRSSVNPGCDLVAAVALEQQSELEVYRQVTGNEYPGEYGIRPSMRRRGTKFEVNNHVNDAAALRKRVAEAFDAFKGDPQAVMVKDLDLMEPVNGGNIHAGNLNRLKLTKQIIRDAYTNKPDVPHLVIHPTFEMPLLKAPDGKPLLHGSRYLNPDFMVLLPDHRIYLIGDEKSFIVRDDTVVEASKLDRVRRQIAAGTLAMWSELERISANAPKLTDGLLIFATPYGLSAARMVREDLSGEIEQIKKAVPQLQRVAVILATLRTQGLHQLAAMTPQLKTNLRESCYGQCILVDYCEELAENQAVVLGRDVYRLLGGKTIDEIIDLASRRQSLPAREAALIDSIEQSVSVIGLSLQQFLTEVA
jgi:hypothetical protein